MSGAVAFGSGDSTPPDGGRPHVSRTMPGREVAAVHPAAMLRTVVDGLALPLPTRTRLIHELTQDLDGLTRRLVARGVPLEEARRRAMETLAPDPVTLAEIEALALPRYRRLTAGLQPSRLRLVERGALALATVALLALEASALVGAGLLDDPSAFLGPVLALGTLTIVTVVAKAFQLGVKGEHRQPRRGLRLVDGLVGLILCTAVVGTLVDFIGLATVMEATPAGGHDLVAAWVVRDAALLSTGIILALTGALGRFGLTTCIAHMEHRHRQALDTDFTSPFHNEELES